MWAAKSESVVEAPRACWHAEWVATFAPRHAVVDAPHGALWTGQRTTFGLARLTGSALQIAEDADRVVLFSGVLTNVDELWPGASLDDAARVVRDLYRRSGEESFAALRGPFAVFVWDRRGERLLVARDHVGIEPVFHARHGRTWYFSPSPDALVAQPGVSGEVDAVACAEWLCGWFPAVEDTSYRAVKRVPPATVLTIAGTEAHTWRYFDLWPENEPIEWLREADLERFDPLLQRAVARTMRAGPAAVFLSGGVDSIAVAAAATDVASADHQALPLALSLTFPDERSNEQPIQAGVARHLGLEQAMFAFDEAVGSRGLIAGTLALTASWPQPMWNMWTPAYEPLAARAADLGRRVVLTGRGGDEWLTITPYLLADQLGRGDVAGAWRLLQMRRRSNGLRGVGPTARFVWNTAGRSLASAALDAIAPGPWHRRRRRRLLSERPAWVAPDPEIRRAMDQRIEQWMEPARPAHGFYVRETRAAVRHPALTQDMEETQEFARRFGLRMLHPFWDIDLVSMLYRVPPALLMRDGRSKWLLRRRLAQRVPGLGLEKRAKISAAHVFRGILERESARAWEQLGGPRSLVQIGVADAGIVESQRQPEAMVETWGGPGRLWTLLNLESWVRQRR